MINKGEIGKIISLEFNEMLGFNHGGHIHGNWRRLQCNSGGHLLEKCCHDIDIVNWLVDSPAQQVASFGGRNFFRPENERHMQRIGKDPKSDSEAYMSWPRANLNPFTADQDIVDNQVAIIEYANGVRATFHTNANCGFEERRLMLVGEEGAIRADLINGLIELSRIGWEEPTMVYKCSGGGHGGGDPVLAEELLNCMFKDALPPLTLNEALYSTIVALAIDKARNENSIVDLCPIWEQAGIDPYRPLSENENCKK